MQKKKEKKQTTNMIAAKLAAFQASQLFKNSQASSFKNNAQLGPVMKRAKKRGDR